MELNPHYLWFNGSSSTRTDTKDIGRFTTNLKWFVLMQFKFSTLLLLAKLGYEFEECVSPLLEPPHTLEKIKLQTQSQHFLRSTISRLPLMIIVDKI